jgi:protein-disulfide isomerase
VCDFHLKSLQTQINHDYSIGPDDAAVTIVEYGDFECPNCKQAAPVIKLLLKRFEGRVRFVFRHFPVKERYPYALEAAEAAESAGLQGEFWPMYDLLLEHRGPLRGTDLRDYAEQLGLDMDRYDDEMRHHVHLPTIGYHLHSGQEDGIHSTPGFLINGAFQGSSFGVHELVDRVAQLIAAANKKP